MERVRPDIYQNKITDIHFDSLKEKGIRLILIDMDNTILKNKEQDIHFEIKEKIEFLKEHFKVILFSNGPKNRVKKIGESLKIPFVFLAFKPCKRSFLKVLKEYKVEPCEVAIIGDQLLTDIKGGNKVGITTILVSPLASDTNFLTRIHRKREEAIFRKMSKKGLFYKERYYE